MDDAALRGMLSRLEAEARDALRRALIAGQPRRDRLSERLARERTSHGRDLADLLDMVTLDAESRRQVVRVLGELEAAG